MCRMVIVGIVVGLCGVSQASDKTARELHLIYMRTKVLKPYNGPTDGRRFPSMAAYDTYRSPRQIRRSRQNDHRRNWMHNRRMNRYYRRRP